MKLNINKIKIIPKTIDGDFGFCVFGNPNEEVQSWIQYHKFETFQSGRYTNMKISPAIKLADIFEDRVPFTYMDGFSPNLNKKLHIGHFSNLVLAQAFKKLGVCQNTVSIFGDTLTGAVSKEEALNYITFIANHFEYKPDKKFLASEMQYAGSRLIDGAGEYEGTKVFEVGTEKMVGVKGDGSTSYFYQDVVLAETLNSSTLYLTGKEQNNHFRLLKVLFPGVEHIGLGLVKVSGKKMSSRDGNVIFMEDFMTEVGSQFEQIDFKLLYNIFAGFILKSTPESDKNVNMDDVSDPKKSEGLYVSYTMARLKSAGVNYVVADVPTQSMEFAFLKARINLMPNILFDAIIELCKEINGLYVHNTIKGNPENEMMFQKKLSQVLWGCQKLGLFYIDKV